MSLKERLQLKFNPAFYWRAVMWAAIVATLLLAALLWLSAANETEDAASSGRRLIIRLIDGAFEGKGVPEEPPHEENATATPTATAQTATGTATPTAEAPPEESPAESPPESPITEIPHITPGTPLNPIKANLVEKVALGPLPVIAPDGTRPWRYYGKPYSLKGNHPMIAVAVTGLGQA
ncbi:MAG: hypothetical protein K2Q01_07140, partial [Rickettsiales bacterium]|nr:hypothetical protein [Rickettsiales bacterium]